MKVIEAAPPWSKFCVCRGCSSTLSVEEMDLRIGAKGGYDFTGERNGAEGAGFTCPRCNTFQLIRVPHPVFVRVKARK